MTATTGSVPNIDIAALFGPLSPVRDTVDRCVMAAAEGAGIMAVSGLPETIRFDAATRGELLQLFAAPRKVIDRLSRNRDDPSRPCIYRGWFGLKEGRAYYYDGMEIGPDVARGEGSLSVTDPLTRPTPMPPESDLPGWRAALRDYFLGMECAGNAVVRSIARSLGLSDQGLADLFRDGMSALRLLRYPLRTACVRAQVPADELYVSHKGALREVISEAHVDFGFMTLLAQRDADGLQARMPDGLWIDVPPAEGHLVVNFGRLLERWTSGRIRATEHRVLSPGRERFSLPFFYEPRVDALIEPLPLQGAEPFTPFLYGDHVWASIPRLRRLFGERSARAAVRP